MNKLTALRTLLDMSQLEASKRSGVPQPRISMHENGTRPLSANQRQRLATALRVPADLF